MTLYRRVQKQIQYDDGSFGRGYEVEYVPVREQHDLVISAGDEELWIRCSCGWVVQPSPWPQTQSLDKAWEAWYWQHAIK